MNVWPSRFVHSQSRLAPLAVVRLVWQAVAAWWTGNLMRLGASVAYYTLFAIAPILLIAVAVAGAVFGDDAVRGEVAGQIDGLIGPDGAAAVQALIEGARRPEGGLVALVTGSLATVLAAGGVFLELQAALNLIWGVTPKAGGVVRQFLWNRAQSFGVVLSIGFLLLVSLAISAGVTLAASWLDGRVPRASAVIQVVNQMFSVAVTAALFGLLFKVLPDARLSYENAAIGGLVTAVLFAGGKQLIGLYLGHSGGASSYGAVGSVAVLLLWVYYSAQIFLIGAQFTKLLSDADRKACVAPE